MDSDLMSTEEACRALADCDPLTPEGCQLAHACRTVIALRSALLDEEAARVGLTVERDGLRSALLDDAARMKRRRDELVARAEEMADAAERECAGLRVALGEARDEARGLRAILEGSTERPTLAEIVAHAGEWRWVVATPRGLTGGRASGAEWITRHAPSCARWWPLDAHGMLCARPRVGAGTTRGGDGR